ncbi:hypothetical protein EJ06DRAFT_520223 [Trichodelitschia bisporula]|uniref:Uncharacterized protein n=1 Tax=Trichodelitschia bisporula TaxID=703511 RepID=A0A6G1I2E1_9PEZI|nr:hypothetical protein EJ06DRAFT_520223 [Trichodelitschia bisporula]
MEQNSSDVSMSERPAKKQRTKQLPVQRPRRPLEPPGAPKKQLSPPMMVQLKKEWARADELERRLRECDSLTGLSQFHELSRSTERCPAEGLEGPAYQRTIRAVKLVKKTTNSKRLFSALQIVQDGFNRNEQLRQQQQEELAQDLKKIYCAVALRGYCCSMSDICESLRAPDGQYFLSLWHVFTEY